MPSSTRTNANGTSGDLAGDDLADLVRAGELLPRVLLVALSDRETRSRSMSTSRTSTVTSVPTSTTSDGWSMCFRTARDVDETVDAAEVHERTEVDDGRDDARTDLALLELGEEGLADLALRLLEPRAARETTLLRFLSSSMILASSSLPTYGWVADTTHLDQRGGEEAAETDVDDQAALDDLDDGAGDDAVLLLTFSIGTPGALVLRTLLGQDQAAFLVPPSGGPGPDDASPERDDLVRVDVVLDAQPFRARG